MNANRGGCTLTTGLEDTVASTATFLFSDIEGSTRRWEERPLAMEVALARHDALVFDAVAAAGGEVFKTGVARRCSIVESLEDALARPLRLHDEYCGRGTISDGRGR